MPDQSVGDTLALSDGSVINNIFFIPPPILSDTISLSDSMRFSTFGLGLTLRDNLNLSDSIKTSRTQNTPISDIVAISDTLSAVLNLVLGVSDAIYIFDALAINLSLGVSDTLSISDTLSVNLAFGVSDKLSVSDAIVNSTIPIFLAIPQLVSDTLCLSDSVSYTNSRSLIALGDNILFSDRINVVMNSTGNSYLRRYLNVS